MTNEQILNPKVRGRLFSARNVAVIGVLGALATVLMTLEFPLPFLPPFYKLDFSEVPVLLGGFAIGPMAGVLIEAIKVVLHMLFAGTQTAGVGDLANFLIGCAFVVPAAVLYRSKKNRAHAVAGMAVGTAVMTVIGGLLNAAVLLPVYAVAFHLPLDQIIAMGTELNANIVDLPTFVFFATTPLNLLKGVLVSILVFILYKHVSPLLHGKRV